MDNNNNNSQEILNDVTSFILTSSEEKENRCPHCNQLLFKGYFLGCIEIKCRKCKNKTKFENIK